MDKHLKPLYHEVTVDKIEMGSSGKYKKTVPNTLKSIFETILNNDELISSINSDERKINIVKSTAFDVIILKNGNEIQAKVLEIDAKEIKYKLLNNIDGPTRIVNKDEVFMVKYKDGFKEVFN